MSSNQMIQFARTIGLEVSLATFGMLEDVFLKFVGKAGKTDGDKGSGQSLLFRSAGSTVIESVASCLFSFLTTNTKSFGSYHSEGDPSQQPCSSRPADAALGFPEHK